MRRSKPEAKPVVPSAPVSPPEAAPDQPMQLPLAAIAVITELERQCNQHRQTCLQQAVQIATLQAALQEMQKGK
jgi:hypothetical protein